MARGRLLYVGGIDGSGKTTQAEAFVRSARGQDARWIYRWARWEPKLTAPLMALARRGLARGGAPGSARPSDDAGYRDFRGGKQRIFRRQWARALWTAAVLLEYLPQVWWRLGPALLRGRFVVCDRYLPDVWIDLAMNFGEGEGGVERLRGHPLNRLFPRPRGGVVLDLDAEAGYQRKNDGTPLAYLQDRRSLYLELARRLGLGVVDAGRPREEVARDVARVLIAAAGPGGGPATV
jgi:thymidylate kinase